MEDQPGVGPFSWIAAGSAQEVVGTTESGSVWVREFGDENPAGTRWNLLSSGKRLPLRNASVFFGRGWAVTGKWQSMAMLSSLSLYQNLTILTLYIPKNRHKC